MALFQFNGLTLRTATREDGAWRIAEEWTAADPEHRDTTPPGFWFDQAMGVESYILEDSSGIVFFFKMMREKSGKIELHIQFPPVAPTHELEAQRRVRVMHGLSNGLEWIERILANRNVSTLFFVSKSPALVRYCEKVLGFKRSNGRMMKRIPAIGAGVASGADSN